MDRSRLGSRRTLLTPEGIEGSPRLRSRWIRPATMFPAMGVAVGALVLAACGGGTSGTATSTSTHSGGSTSATSAPAAPPVVQTTSSGALGTILVDPSGKTLYRFDHDTATTSACTGACNSLWPALTVPAGTTPTGANGLSGLGTITLASGVHQVTYQGHPLYTYSGDQAPGQTKGNGFAGIWHVVQVSSSTGSTGTAGSTGGGSTPSTSAPASSGGGY